MHHFRGVAVVNAINLLHGLKRADFEFVRCEHETPNLPRKKSSHLHPNRPSDQLS